MSGKAEVEVVMEYNIRTRTRIDHTVWAPCATSTPVRKPLVILNNTEVIDGTKKCDFMPPKSVCGPIAVDTIEGRRPADKRNKSAAKKKFNKNSRILHCLDDDDDDDESEDEKTGSQANKHLIIKLSSSQFNKRSLRKNKPVMKSEPNFNKQGKVDDLTKSAKANDNEIEKCNENKNSIPLHESQDFKESANSAEVKESLKDLNASGKNGITKKDKNVMNKADNHRKSSNDHCNKEAIDFAPQKRKNKNMKLSHVKRLKTELKSPISCANIDTREKTKLISNEIKNAKIGRIADIIKHENLNRLSVSHEIFSDSKEREFRDSLDLTTADHEELPVGNLNYIKLPTQEKTLPKWKSSNSRQSKKSEPTLKIWQSENSELSRPKRLKKSPKAFWLPKLEVNQDHSPDNNNDLELVKNKKVDQILISTERSDEPEILDYKVSTSTEVGSSGIPSDTVYVKTISELEFVENGFEDEKKKFLVATGWQFSKFKCCALKINAKCEVSSRTKSNHFGGVILKGRLSMKIGETEVKMKGGQMFYIPPLTDWRAINTGRVDCVLYYWVSKL